MKNIEKKQRKSNAKSRAESAMNLINGDYGFDSRMALIQQLIPIGLMAVEEALQEEVLGLAGIRYRHDNNPNKRWGVNDGSVYLGHQKHSLQIPRVRNEASRKEVPLTSYRAMQSDQGIDDQILAQVINGISARKFEKASTQIPSVFGIQKSSVSRKFIKASAKKLKAFQDRDLSSHDIIVIFMDGKSFAENEMIIALGVTLSGQKIVLGAIESSTENGKVCRDFLVALQDRGLNSEEPILFVIDGAKGLRKGIQTVFGKQAIIQRCQWHKRENVVAYLPKGEQSQFRKKLQKAYEQKTYGQAKQKLSSIRKELQLINESAVASLDEGLEETLTLHRLGLFEPLGISLKTTNCIESLNSQLKQYTGRVSYWKNSNQRWRWVATALLEIEPSLRKVKGYRFLPLLKRNMEKYAQEKNQTKAA
ncbi:IS256 family transposase [bacterium AH-315-L15]|nr:IS256 family transposase [bacterium AH-315-L15]